MGKDIKNLITLEGEDGDIEVEVIDQTEVKGHTYLLVADVTSEEEDSDCYILKDLSTSTDEEAKYEVVSDEEADSIFEVFSKQVGDEVDLKK